MLGESILAPKQKKLKKVTKEVSGLVRARLFAVKFVGT